MYTVQYLARTKFQWQLKRSSSFSDVLYCTYSISNTFDEQEIYVYHSLMMNSLIKQVHSLYIPSHQGSINYPTNDNHCYKESDGETKVHYVDTNGYQFTNIGNQSTVSKRVRLSTRSDYFIIVI